MIIKILTGDDTASVVQLERTSSLVRVVMSSSPDRSKIFPHHLRLLLIDYIGIGGSESTIGDPL